MTGSTLFDFLLSGAGCFVSGAGMMFFMCMPRIKYWSDKYCDAQGAAARARELEGALKEAQSDLYETLPLDTGNCQMAERWIARDALLKASPDD